MQYLTDIYSPETYREFSLSNQKTSGFPIHRQSAASRVQAGDLLLCYVTRFSRWCGVLEIINGPLIDELHIRVPPDDPYVVEFEVRPLVWLPLELSIPIRDDSIWENLSFTQNAKKESSHWTGILRSTLRTLNRADGSLLDKQLRTQAILRKAYAMNQRDTRLLKKLHCQAHA